ncbi:MAG: MNIO family bufferin maturase [Maritimibacter sp.]
MFDAALDHLPSGPGVGFKSQHFQSVMENPGAVRWVEIHAENYMSEGGRSIAQLKALAARFPISVHGVGLSIGGEDPLDTAHLARLKHLIDWLKPARFSEHLAWSSHGGAYFNDLLPLPYTEASLSRIAAHIDQVQQTLGRQMLLENPATYLSFQDSTLKETDFLAALVARTGCGLLLDVNNVFVACTNGQTDPRSYLAAFPVEAVGEMHLGGHDAQHDETGAPLLIDSHGAAVVDPVWSLYAEVIAAIGPCPTLIEWDNDVPDWATLEREAARAAKVLERLAA